MQKNIYFNIRRVLGILISISIVIAGICFISACLSIYNFGEGSYSREIVAETFKKIAIPVYICLALTVSGFVFELIYPSEKKKIKNILDNTAILKKLSAKKDLDSNEDLAEGIRKERNLRKTNLLILASLLAIGSIVFLIFALNPNNYPENSTELVITAMKWLLPCFVIPFGFSIYAVYSNEKSIKREIAIVIELPNATTVKSGCESNNKNTTKIIRYAVLVLALGIMVYGAVAGGTESVLAKAVNICTECIGLG